MIIVNPIFLHEFVGPLIGGADSEDSIISFGKYQSDSEEDVKHLAKDILIPEFIKQKEILQRASKHSLAYYLTYYNRIDFEAIFNSLLLPLETPVNCRLFFRWLWEVFFEGESTEYIKAEIVKEDFDVNAPMLLLTGTDGYRDSLN